jgi:APA family basic amino acid/polyamine antiporter
LAVQCVLSVVLLLLGGSFRQLFSLTIFAEWLFYLIAGSTVFVFRRREPQAARPYRMWGYPVVPAIFAAVAAALLCYTFKNNWPNSGYGLLVILAGIPVFAWFSSRRQKKSA